MQDPIVINDSQQAFGGFVFHRRKTGYYQRWTNERPKPVVVFLHREVWVANNGAIPGKARAYRVHHIDHDKANNALANLELIEAGRHVAEHMNTPEARERARTHMRETVMPKARAWHSTPEGRAWHMEHGKDVAAKIAARPPVTAACERCAKEFIKRTAGRFCSPACRAASTRQRRAAGIPADGNRQTILRSPPRALVCSMCGEPFDTRSGRTSKCAPCRLVAKRAAHQAWLRARSEAVRTVAMLDTLAAKALASGTPEDLAAWNAAVQLVAWSDPPPMGPA